MRALIRITALVFFLGNTYASYDFEHPDCKVRLVPGGDSYVDQVAREVLIKKKFVPQELIKGKAFIPGDTYYTYEKILTGKLFKTCTIRSYLKRASSRLPSKKDRLFYSKEVKRSLPRITLGGKERCRKALQETFIHIPRCKPIGFAGEKK